VTVSRDVIAEFRRHRFGGKECAAAAVRLVLTLLEQNRNMIGDRLAAGMTAMLSGLLLLLVLLLWVIDAIGNRARDS
jgi:hypothetical protein